MIRRAAPKEATRSSLVPIEGKFVSTHRLNRQNLPHFFSSSSAESIYTKVDAWLFADISSPTKVTYTR